MAKVSVLIPSRDEKFLENTVEDMVKKANGEVEVIAVIDGPTSYPLTLKYPNVITINLPEPLGMRHGINLAASIATGKYLMKIDSHCTISQGYDEALQAECENNWVVVARRNELGEDWKITDTTPVDYFYMSSPWTSPQGYMRMSRWITRDRQKSNIMLDETLAFSGSMWFMSKEHFFRRIRLMDEERFGQWSGEPEELSCKTWLGGGKVMINKKVTYAHLRRKNVGSPYGITWDTALIGLRESARYWSSDEWPHRIHDFEWLIDHFWPLPTKASHCNGERYYWEEDWKEKYYKIGDKNSTEKVKFYLDTDFPIAKDSYDHLYPLGTMRDNSRNPEFNDKLKNYSGSVLDIGCAGGGFVKDCLDEGRTAVGLEGSDYDKRAGQFEWVTIPDNLFTCDVTKPFTLHSDGDTPYQFDIVTAWEFFEHIEKKDLKQLFINVRNHLADNGLLIAAISNKHYPHDEHKEIDLHRTVQGRNWWLNQFRANGFVEDQGAEEHFTGSWLRNDPGYKFVFRKINLTADDFETPLCQLAFKYGSDKCPQIKHHYSPLYYDLLKDQKDKVKKVLEIGVGDAQMMAWTNVPGYVTGASLYMWRDFFPNAQIYGADILPNLVFKDDRIETFQCDQSKKTDLKRLIKHTGKDIDLFIDDGSHLPEHQVFTCLTLMPMLKKDVVYVIEDVGDLGIMEKLKDYDCQYKMFRHKSSWDDRVIVVRNKQPLVKKGLSPRRKKKAKVSIIIPSRNETYECQPGVTTLQRTIQDIYEKATGDIEVLVTFDGPPYQSLPNHPNLRTFNLPESMGLKHSINLMAKKAKGKYLFKLDSHCMLSQGFDEVLATDMEDNWIVTPRFYVLNAEEWKWQDEKFYDYFFLPCPLTDKKMFRFQAGGHWRQRTQERLDIPIDENMKLHGSAFFVTKEFFTKSLGGVTEGWIDPSSGEDIELSLKTWLGPWGGKLMVNKNCWYAHMHKGGQRPRGWHVSDNQINRTYLEIANYWMANKWKQREHDLAWLIEKFWPVPTWPKNWRKLYAKWLKKNG